jgi:hypothetical protein
MVRRSTLLLTIGATLGFVVLAVHSYRSPFRLATIGGRYAGSPLEHPPFELTIDRGWVSCEHSRPATQMPAHNFQLPGLLLSTFTCSGGYGFYRAHVSIWLLAGLTAIYPLLKTVRLGRRMLQARRGLCFACGYDLRGSGGGACPECGREVSGAAGCGPAGAPRVEDEAF